ncbi:MAG: dienelactone hydrolase family protein [Roseiarcus sp.]|jgi:carboxymethylenebutenolidase
MLDLDHLNSLHPPTAPLDRRAIVKASLTVGFCAAVAPVWAQVIQTSAEGLVAGEVRVPSSGADIPAYRAMPDRGGPFPAVLVIHEIFGVHEYIKDVCRRWAKLGYYAIAPDLYARQGDASKETDIARLMAEIVAKVPDAQVAGDLDATFAFAGGSGSADVGRAAVTGFCWGGRQAWLYAAHNPALKAGVAWYGPLAYKSDPLHPDNPPDIVASLKVPVLGLYGGKDTGITPAQVDSMKDRLAAAGGASKIIVFADSGHAFHADYRPSYHEGDAKASWTLATAWLKDHGV